MSQYISSFLIDPVVRQARRFSRPALDPPHPELRPSLTDDGAAPRSDGLEAAAVDTTEAFPPLTLGEDPPATITSDPEAQIPIPLPGLENEELQALEHEFPIQNPTLLHRVEPVHSGIEVNQRRYSPSVNEGTLNNPLHGVHDGLRSTTSSISNSARSIIDVAMSSADISTSTSSAQDSRGRGDSGGNRSVDGALPADDGMGPMRQRILAIQRTDSSNEVKARLVHRLMTERHNSSQQSLLAPRTLSPGSIHSSERQFAPSSPKSMDSLRQTMSPPASSASNVDITHPFHLSPDDLKQTYYKPPKSIPRDEESDRRPAEEDEEDQKALGCEHYKRNIKLQCSACHRWYTCRFCHDEIEDHMLNRRETKNMLCMLCGCAQPASEECGLCGERAAWYYCGVCKLWDDDLEKSIYHCNDCGICRVGEGLGKDFFHCKVREY